MTFATSANYPKAMDSYNAIVLLDFLISVQGKSPLSKSSPHVLPRAAT